MRRIVIVNAFERGNRGDAALLSVLLGQVRQTHPDAEIQIAGFENPAQWPEFEGAPNLGSLRRYLGEEDVTRLQRVLRKLCLLPVLVLAGTRVTRRWLLRMSGLLPAEPRREVRALAEADLVISLGGGYLHGRPNLASDLNIAFLLLPLWLAQQFGVPVVTGPQSYGPFPRRIQRAMVRRVLGNARAVLVREDISRNQLREIGLDPGLLTRDVDSAFAFRSQSARPWRTELDIPSDATVIAVTARQWLAPDGQTAYEDALVAGIRHLLGRRHYVVLVPQVTCAFQGDDDRRVNARIASRLSDPHLRTITHDRFDHHDVHALYAGADFVIGTRFHSVIFALTAQVPCLAIEYEHKTRGIMRDLGLEQWVMSIDTIRAGRLITLIDELMAAGADYRARLRDTLPRYLERARDAGALLAARRDEELTHAA